MRSFRTVYISASQILFRLVVISSYKTSLFLLFYVRCRIVAFRIFISRLMKDSFEMSFMHTDIR